MQAPDAPSMQASDAPWFRHGPSFFIISSTSVFAGSAETWGIATVYLTLVLAVGRLVRSGLGGLGFRIQLEDMGARVELITQLVEYIYQVQGQHSMAQALERHGTRPAIWSRAPCPACAMCRLEVVRFSLFASQLCTLSRPACTSASMATITTPRKQNLTWS